MLGFGLYAFRFRVKVRGLSFVSQLSLRGGGMGKLVLAIAETGRHLDTLTPRKHASSPTLRTQRTAGVFTDGWLQGLSSPKLRSS